MLRMILVIMLVSLTGCGSIISRDGSVLFPNYPDQSYSTLRYNGPIEPVLTCMAMGGGMTICR